MIRKEFFYWLQVTFGSIKPVVFNSVNITHFQFKDERYLFRLSTVLFIEVSFVLTVSSLSLDGDVTFNRTEWNGRLVSGTWIISQFFHLIVLNNEIFVLKMKVISYCCLGNTGSLCWPISWSKHTFSLRSVSSTPVSYIKQPSYLLRVK